MSLKSVFSTCVFVALILACVCLLDSRIGAMSGTADSFYEEAQPENKSTIPVRYSAIKIAVAIFLGDMRLVSPSD